MVEVKSFVDIPWERIMDNLLEGCQIIDFSYHYLYVNKTVARQGHQTKEGLLGHTMMEVYPGIEKTKFFSHLRTCMEKREPQRMDNEFVYPDGQKAWFDLRLQPVPEGVFIFSIDITERKKYEEIIEQEKIKKDAILANIGEGLIVTDMKGNVVMINKSAQDMLGYSSEELVGKQVIDNIKMVNEKGDMFAKKDRPIAIVLAMKNSSLSTKASYIRKNGKQFAASVTVTPIFTQDKLVGAIEIFRDITKEQAADKAKTEFVSIASHALRTPLGVAKWYLEAIEKEGYLTKAPERLRNYIEEVYLSNERLLLLVRDLLSISRIDQGKIRDSPENVDLKLLLTEIMKVMNILAERNSNTITLTIEKTLPSLFIDPLQLRDVIENLILNAIKYSKPRGHIEVTVKHKQNQIRIAVKDNGIGIREEDQKKIFTKFFRAQNAITSNTEGSGLGLYVVKSYIEKWGGEIAVQSKEGKGSTFSLLMPIISGKKRKEGGDSYEENTYH